MGTRGIRHPRSLHFAARSRFSNPVCGDITISAIASGRALTALGLYSGLCERSDLSDEVRLFENLQAGVSCAK